MNEKGISYHQFVPFLLISVGDEQLTRFPTDIFIAIRKEPHFTFNKHHFQIQERPIKPRHCPVEYSRNKALSLFLL